MSISKITFGLVSLLVVLALIEAKPQNSTANPAGSGATSPKATTVPVTTYSAQSPSPTPTPKPTPTPTPTSTPETNTEAPPTTTTEAPNGSPIYGSDVASVVLLAICSLIGRRLPI